MSLSQASLRIPSQHSLTTFLLQMKVSSQELLGPSPPKGVQSGWGLVIGGPNHCYQLPTLLFSLQVTLHSFELCFGSLSCWKIHFSFPYSRFPEGIAWWTRIEWYSSFLIIPSILNISLTCLPQSTPKTLLIRPRAWQLLGLCRLGGLHLSFAGNAVFFSN